MQELQIVPVILCGGSGTRLWPVSRESVPKQFSPLFGEKSLLSLTMERAAAITTGKILTVAADPHRFLVEQAAMTCGTKVEQVLEPVSRNTAAAIAAAAFSIRGKDVLMMVMPSDHYIPDITAFLEMVASGVAAASDGNIVTFGITPTHPATGFGYIRRESGASGCGVAKVERFVEKPALDRATEMLLEGGYFWNSGMLLARRDVLLDALTTNAPKVFEAMRESYQDSLQDNNFLRLGRVAMTRCPSISFDHAVLEHDGRVAMVPFSSGWSDVGSWDAVAAMSAADESGNRIVGKGYAHRSQNTYIHAPHRPVVALGVRDLVIVDSPDALLVANAEHTQEVREVVEMLKTSGVPEADQHRRVPRPWGAYDSVDHGERFQVKRITVNPGAQLSLQMHHHRAEHWIVVKGTALVTRDNEVFLLNENQSTYIPIGAKHRLENPGVLPLEIIEVQSGAYLGEDDIVRFKDEYGRAEPTGSSEISAHAKNDALVLLEPQSCEFCAGKTH